MRFRLFLAAALAVSATLAHAQTKPLSPLVSGSNNTTVLPVIDYSNGQITGVMLIVLLEAIFMLASDNVVPAGVAASSVPDAAARTLRRSRLMYLAGTLLMATLTHIAQR